MHTLLKWITRLITLAVVLGIVFTALSYYLLNRSLPDYNADLSVKGISAPVEVIFDENAIPHIHAETNNDAYFALGLAHAQDRLWQMEITRRTVQGRLSELFGESTLQTDILMRTLRLYDFAERALPHQSAKTQQALNAYAAGVNAWITHVNTKAKGRGAPEFFISSDPVAAWRASDSIAVLKLMALRLTSSASSEVNRALFLLNLDADKVADLFPDYPESGKQIISDYQSLFPSKTFADMQPPTHLAEHTFVANLGNTKLSGASNAWAVNGSRSATGASLMANDPHLWLSAPSLWYLAHMTLPDSNAGGVIGATIPGVPAVLIGRNKHLSWGLTTLNMDDQDILIEKVNPDDERKYLTPSGWEQFTERRTIISVKDEKDHQLIMRSSRHGPIIPDNQFNLKSVTPSGHVAALKWTALTEQDTSIDSAIQLMSVKSVEDVSKVAPLHVAPAQNLTVADKDKVAIYTVGAAPRRYSNSRSKGRIPAPGWVAENDWDGFYSWGILPKSVNPSSGMVANANNRVSNASFPRHLSFDWAPPYRFHRIEKLLKARDVHSNLSFQAMQNDIISEMARQTLPLIASKLWWRTENSSAITENKNYNEALKLLANWNGTMDAHRIEPLIFTAWMYALPKRLAADELGPLIDYYNGLRPLFIERVYRNIGNASQWCDISKTTERENCTDIASLALSDAIAELTELYGEDMRAWRWGKAHKAKHKHALLDNLGIGLIGNIQHESSGGDYTLQRARSRGFGHDRYANIHAGGLRMVYDFTDLDRSVFIISTGQSGHPMSRFYDNLVRLWRVGDYIPMSMKREDAKAGSVGSINLTPMIPN